MCVVIQHCPRDRVPISTSNGMFLRTYCDSYPCDRSGVARAVSDPAAFRAGRSQMRVALALRLGDGPASPKHPTRDGLDGAGGRYSGLGTASTADTGGQREGAPGKGRRWKGFWRCEWGHNSPEPAGLFCQGLFLTERHGPGRVPHPPFATTGTALTPPGPVTNPVQTRPSIAHGIGPRDSWGSRPHLFATKRASR
jgi:hypothetical protein